MNDKFTSTILFFSISVILISSYHAFNSQFSAFAQTPDDPSAYPGETGPIPEDNSTFTNTGPIPEDNYTNPDSSMNPPDVTSPEDNYTNPDSSMNPPDVTSPDNQTGPENMNPPHMHMSSNSTVSGLPPFEQVKSGTSPKDVTCKQGFTLIIKIDDGSPACVDPQVMQILIQRGW